jgi:hypothetical protein
VPATLSQFPTYIRMPMCPFAGWSCGGWRWALRSSGRPWGAPAACRPAPAARSHTAWAPPACPCLRHCHHTPMPACTGWVINPYVSPTAAGLGHVVLRTCGRARYNTSWSAVSAHRQHSSTSLRYTSQVNAWLHTPSSVNGSPPGVMPGPDDPMPAAVYIASSTLGSSPLLYSSSPPQFHPAAPEAAAGAAGVLQFYDTPMQHAGEAVGSQPAAEPSTPIRRCAQICSVCLSSICHSHRFLRIPLTHTTQS